MTAVTRPARWKILMAFAIIYFVWGSTFLAIRVGVHEVPPLLLAAMRFLVAGIALYLWLRLKGTPRPGLRQWLGASVLATLIFVLDYGCLFWAEQRVPSGIAAVVLATIPVFIALLEILVLRTQRLTSRLGLALLSGIIGVGVLMNRSFSFGEVPVNRAGAAALLIAAFTWSLATILTKKFPLPESKPMSAAAQMLSGGLQLVIVSVLFGEWRGLQLGSVSWQAWVALLYLITAGSIVGFTAYIWLLHYESPTKVGTYAYVNPLVAVGLGYFAAGESIGPRTLFGTLLILVSVIAITTMRTKAVQAAPAKQPALRELSGAKAD